MPFFLVSFLDPDSKEPICACPRGVLKKAVENAEKSGFQCFAGVEYEVRMPFLGPLNHKLTYRKQYFQFKGTHATRRVRTQVLISV